MKIGFQYLEINKPIAKICENGIVKFYKPDGSRNTEHPSGFFIDKDLSFLKSNFKVIY